MTIEARREHEESLVKTYYEALTGEFAVTGYTWEQCWRDYEFQLWRYASCSAPAFRHLALSTTPRMKTLVALSDRRLESLCQTLLSASHYGSRLREAAQAA